MSPQNCFVSWRTGSSESLFIRMLFCRRFHAQSEKLLCTLSADVLLQALDLLVLFCYGKDMDQESVPGDLLSNANTVQSAFTISLCSLHPVPLRITGSSEFSSAKFHLNTLFLWGSFTSLISNGLEKWIHLQAESGLNLFGNSFWGSSMVHVMCLVIGI